MALTRYSVFGSVASVSDELWKGGLSEADEPRERLDGIQCGVIPSELGFENGEAEAMGGLEWEDLIEEH